jgi:4-amino-4-deoxy-L-arabinose transferase-like glycosyltransferase
LAWTSLAGFVLGLSVLTKGLAGIVIVGIAYGGYLAFTRRLCKPEYLRAAWALFIAVAIGLSWYIVVEAVQPGFLYYYFIERHVLGFFTRSQPHGASPWWYYAPFLLVGGLPWIIYLPALLRDVRDEHRAKKAGGKKLRGGRLIRRHARMATDRSLAARPARRMGPDAPWEHFSQGRGCDAYGRRPLLLLGCWFVGCTLFLTASHSKLVTYIWPVFPAVAILAAIAWVRKLDGLLGEAADRWMNAGVRATCLIGPIGLPVTLAVTETVLPVSFPRLTWIVAALAGLTSLAPLWAWRGGRMRWTMALSTAAVCGQLAVLLWLALPQAAETLSARQFARHCNRGRVLPTQVVATEGRIGSIVFYLDRQLRDRLRSEPLAARGKDGRLLRPPTMYGDDNEERVAARPVPGGFEWTRGAILR